MLPWKADRRTTDHQLLFAERYDRIRAWARQIVGPDTALVEDLVHDAFVQFALARPDLAGIANLDGYLFAMLRNLHLSHLRRLARGPEGPSSIVDYESAERRITTASSSGKTSSGSWRRSVPPAAA